MLTRCPDCATHFRVTADQLKLRAGRVRCGECQHVFNALDTLIEEPPVIMAPARPGPAISRSSPANREEAVGPPAPIVDGGESLAESAEWHAPVPDQTPFEEPDRESVMPEAHPSSADALAAPGIEPIETAPVEAPENSAPDLEPPPDASTGESSSREEIDVEPPPAPRRWPWVIGILLALGSLGLQAVLTYRVEVAVLVPETRPVLEATCQALGCDVGLPAKVALVGIETSDLHPDTQQKGRLALTATLKNRAPFAQRFPHLELTLTDTADKAIVRKILAPSEYLPPGTGIPGGMTPNADIAISIALDAGDVPASGYRLYIFYP